MTECAGWLAGLLVDWLVGCPFCLTSHLTAHARSQRGNRGETRAALETRAARFASATTAPLHHHYPPPPTAPRLAALFCCGRVGPTAANCQASAENDPYPPTTPPSNTCSPSSPITPTISALR
ncbi:hypothetical protein BZA05DRAFT_75254 [Tricharina praecox]|uniref:uncharacterized protein n=1 Tax=Tricharina praecox TaxID=43433 RepID=UPI00222060AD|nr:uncharacterized protein BZA05DRAFT_75254 [Tricharina praecox]KAI5849725.1 hypothetical protein BZA05DRAFT_75254 [Tricharina praecox]